MACPCENNITFNKQNSNYIEDCDYTLEQILLLKNKLVCLKDNGLFNHESRIYNTLLGLFLSAINTQKVCYLKKELDNIKSYITEIINSDQC